MKRKWRPREHRWGKGWILDTLGGEPAFSDGCALFIGVRKGSPHDKPGVFDRTLKQLQLKSGSPLKPGHHEMRGPLPVLWVGSVLVQEMYYEHALSFPGVKFYAGRKGQCVICKVGDKVVGMIMGMRA